MGNKGITIDLSADIDMIIVWKAKQSLNKAIAQDSEYRLTQRFNEDLATIRELELMIRREPRQYRHNTRIIHELWQIAP